MAPLFSWNRSSTQSNNSQDSDKTLVDPPTSPYADGRTSPTPTHASKKRPKLKKSPSQISDSTGAGDFEVVVLPDGSVVRVRPGHPTGGSGGGVGGGKGQQRETVPYETVMAVARETIRVLRGLGVHSCAMGGLAERVYGSSKDPSEIDLLLLTDKLDYAAVLRRLIQHNPKFFIVPLASSLPPPAPQAYPSPYTSPPEPTSLTPAQLDDTTALSQALFFRTPHASLSIQFHLPPTPTIPYLTSADIHWHLSFPLLPLSLVLLTKLRLWAINRYVPAYQSPTLAGRKQQWAEHAELEQLMSRLARERVNLPRERVCESLFAKERPEEERPESWVRGYLEVYPDTRALWAVLGIRIARDDHPPLSPQSPARQVQHPVHQQRQLKQQPSGGVAAVSERIQHLALHRTRTSSSASGSTSSSFSSPGATPSATQQTYTPRPSFSSDMDGRSVTSRPSLSFSRSQTPISESPTFGPVWVRGDRERHQEAGHESDRERVPRAGTPTSLVSRRSFRLGRSSQPPPSGPPPPVPQIPGRDRAGSTATTGTVAFGPADGGMERERERGRVGMLRSKSPFGRKKSRDVLVPAMPMGAHARAGKGRMEEESYLDWD